VNAEANLLTSLGEQKLDVIEVQIGVPYHWQCWRRDRTEYRKSFVILRELPVNDAQNAEIARVMEHGDYVEGILVQRCRQEIAGISEKLLQAISSLKRILLSQKKVFADFAGFRFRAGEETKIEVVGMERNCRICGEPIAGNIKELELLERMEAEQMRPVREQPITNQAQIGSEFSDVELQQ
jgi:hypothetical protein